RLLPPAIFSRQMDQRGEPRRPLDDGADRGPVDADDEVPFVVAGDGAVLSIRGPLADEDIRGHVSPRHPLRPRPRHTKRPPGAKTQNELALERPTALDEQRLVDGLVTDPHAVIIGE